MPDRISDSLNGIGCRLKAINNVLAADLDALYELTQRDAETLALGRLSGATSRAQFSTNVAHDPVGFLIYGPHERLIGHAYVHAWDARDSVALFGALVDPIERLGGGFAHLEGIAIAYDWTINKLGAELVVMETFAHQEPQFAGTLSRFMQRDGETLGWRRFNGVRQPKVSYSGTPEMWEACEYSTRDFWREANRIEVG